MITDAIYYFEWLYKGDTWRMEITPPSNVALTLPATMIEIPGLGINMPDKISSALDNGLSFGSQKEDTIKLSFDLRFVNPDLAYFLSHPLSNTGTINTGLSTHTFILSNFFVITKNSNPMFSGGQNPVPGFDMELNMDGIPFDIELTSIGKLVMQNIKPNDISERLIYGVNTYIYTRGEDAYTIDNIFTKSWSGRTVQYMLGEAIYDLKETDVLHTFKRNLHLFKIVDLHASILYLANQILAQFVRKTTTTAYEHTPFYAATFYKRTWTDTTNAGGDALNESDLWFIGQIFKDDNDNIPIGGFLVSGNGSLYDYDTAWDYFKALVETFPSKVQYSYANVTKQLLIKFNYIYGGFSYSASQANNDNVFKITNGGDFEVRSCKGNLALSSPNLNVVEITNFGSMSQKDWEHKPVWHNLPCCLNSDACEWDSTTHFVKWSGNEFQNNKLYYVQSFDNGISDTPHFIRVHDVININDGITNYINDNPVVYDNFIIYKDYGGGVTAWVFDSISNINLQINSTQQIINSVYTACQCVYANYSNYPPSEYIYKDDYNETFEAMLPGDILNMTWDLSYLPYTPPTDIISILSTKAIIREKTIDYATRKVELKTLVKGQA